MYTPPPNPHTHTHNSPHQVRESTVLHLPVAKIDTDWHQATRLDHVHATANFGSTMRDRFDNVSVRAPDEGALENQRWFCKVCHAMSYTITERHMIYILAAPVSLLGYRTSPAHYQCPTVGLCPLLYDCGDRRSRQHEASETSLGRGGQARGSPVPRQGPKVRGAARHRPDQAGAHCSFLARRGSRPKATFLCEQIRVICLNKTSWNVM